MISNIWVGLEVVPPNKFVEVIDKHGNIELAKPTFYPFKVGKFDVAPCVHYWDGNWMIQFDELESKFGKVVAWRPIY